MVEPFTPALKACRDILVDDVSRHLGVPIIGTPTPIASISRGDVAQARLGLARAAAALARDPGPFGPHVQAARKFLDDVTRLLGAPGGVALVEMVSPRHVRTARSRLHDAVDHLTTVLFDQPGREP
jgi:hypothetical protein